MIALDTNVLVRVVTADDPAQLEAALAVMRSEALWVCKTVLLETEWVLRYTYRLSRDETLRAFRGLLGYRTLQVEDRGCVLQALSLCEKGLDFADALHLASCGPADRFATFDRHLAKAAQKSGGGGWPVVDLLSPASA
jgi:predicted nucleic-acid-binding protein